MVTGARRTGARLAWAGAIAVALACGRSGDRPEAERPLPDSLPVVRLTALDSALARPGITVEYHWEAPDTAVPGLEVTSYAHPATGLEIRLADTVAFDLDGVVAAEVRPAGPGHMVVLRTSMPGGERLLHVTTWHQRERIGVVVNGHLVTLAVVRTPLTNMLPVIDGPIPLDQARVLSERINERLRAQSADSGGQASPAGPGARAGRS